MAFLLCDHSQYHLGNLRGWHHAGNMLTYSRLTTGCWGMLAWIWFIYTGFNIAPSTVYCCTPYQVCWLTLTKELLFNISIISWPSTLMQSAQPSNRTTYSQLPFKNLTSVTSYKTSPSSSFSRNCLSTSVVGSSLNNKWSSAVRWHWGGMVVDRVRKLGVAGFNCIKSSWLGIVYETWRTSMYCR